LEFTFRRGRGTWGGATHIQKEIFDRIAADKATTTHHHIETGSTNVDYDMCTMVLFRQYPLQASSANLA